LYRRITQFTDIWDAQKILLEGVGPVREREYVHVFESYGRVVAEPVYSPADLPAEHASHMDGFAVNSKDLENASSKNPVRLRVVGESLPGRPSPAKLKPGEAVRILTGAYLPEGADAVVPQEFVSREGSEVVVSASVKPWEYVDLRGFDVRKGQLLFGAGHRVKAADASLMAALGIEHVSVLRRPRVGVVAVGDELTESFEEARRGRVLNTHSRFTVRLVEAAGGEPVYLGIVPDDVETYKEFVSRNIGSLDMLLSIAGSSISEKDVSSLSAGFMNRSQYVHGLKLQPGRIGGFTFIRGKPWIFLPGLVMSTLNVFMFLAYPALRKMQYMEPRFYWRRSKAILSGNVYFRKYIDFVKVVWVRVDEESDPPRCYPILGESSGLSIPSRSDGFILGEPGVKQLESGTQVYVHYPPAL
jgi:molybdopterin molybdotransferase